MSVSFDFFNQGREGDSRGSRKHMQSRRIAIDAILSYHLIDITTHITDSFIHELGNWIYYSSIDSELVCPPLIHIKQHRS